MLNLSKISDIVASLTASVQEMSNVKTIPDIEGSYSGNVITSVSLVFVGFLKTKSTY